MRACVRARARARVCVCLRVRLVVLCHVCLSCCLACGDGTLVGRCSSLGRWLVGSYYDQAVCSSGETAPPNHLLRVRGRMRVCVARLAQSTLIPSRPDDGIFMAERLTDSPQVKLGMHNPTQDFAALMG